jgi:hypothetical protein
VCDAVRLGQHSKEQVLGADVVVVEPAGFFLGRHDDLAGSCGESFKHWFSVQDAYSPVKTLLIAW